MRRIRLPRKLPTVQFPLHYPGAPQRRLFFPEWYFTLAKPKEKMPSNYVRFHVPADMTQYDVKEYLDKIYNVPVISITLGIVSYLPFKSPNPFRRLSYSWKFMDPFKIAHVYVADGQTFEFPDVFKAIDIDEDDEESLNENLTPMEMNEKLEIMMNKQSTGSDKDKMFFQNKWLS